MIGVTGLVGVTGLAGLGLLPLLVPKKLGLLGLLGLIGLKKKKAFQGRDESGCQMVPETVCTAVNMEHGGYGQEEHCTTHYREVCDANVAAAGRSKRFASGARRGIAIMALPLLAPLPLLPLLALKKLGLLGLLGLLALKKKKGGEEEQCYQVNVCGHL